MTIRIQNNRNLFLSVAMVTIVVVKFYCFFIDGEKGGEKLRARARRKRLEEK